jgi:ribose transport system ATP-binding protein
MTATAHGAPTQDTRPPTLEMRGISKTFPGTKALSNVQLKAWGGEIQSLMGENGAGKSTLMKVLSGAYQADAGGQILIDGNVIDITNPQVARDHGIAIIYQELSLLPKPNFVDTICFGYQPQANGSIN